jgi:hypothetical protein
MRGKSLRSELTLKEMALRHLDTLLDSSARSLGARIVSLIIFFALLLTGNIGQSLDAVVSVLRLFAV